MPDINHMTTSDDDGCHPNQKSIPWSKDNLCWCCSGCISFYAEQFAVFKPGKRSITFLNKRGIGSQQFYQTKKTNEESLESIPIDY